MKSKRQAVKEARQRQSKLTTGLAVGFITLAVIVIGSVVVIPIIKPKPTVIPTSTIDTSPTAVVDPNMLGEVIPPTGAGDHITDDVNPNPYNSNPPTSGHHYARWLDAGFYEVVKPADGPFPEGHLVHNLEHGYIIFWYNCKIVSDSECATMKSQIKAVMDSAQNFKLIAYPWESINVPVAMTSWGYRLMMKTFDANLAKSFIDQHRNRAPEPNMP